MLKRKTQETHRRKQAIILMASLCNFTRLKWVHTHVAVVASVGLSSGDLQHIESQQGLNQPNLEVSGNLYCN